MTSLPAAAPALKFQPGTGFRFGVSIDDGPVQEVNVHADESEAYWERIVSDGVAKFVTNHRVEQPGRHTVTFWALDPGLVLQHPACAGELEPCMVARCAIVDINQTSSKRP